MTTLLAVPLASAGGALLAIGLAFDRGRIAVLGLALVTAALTIAIAGACQ